MSSKDFLSGFIPAFTFLEIAPNDDLKTAFKLAVAAIISAATQFFIKWLQSKIKVMQVRKRAKKINNQLNSKK